MVLVVCPAKVNCWPQTTRSTPRCQSRWNTASPARRARHVRAVERGRTPHFNTLGYDIAPWSVWTSRPPRAQSSFEQISSRDFRPSRSAMALGSHAAVPRQRGHSPLQVRRLSSNFPLACARLRCTMSAAFPRPMREVASPSPAILPRGWH